MKIYQNLLQSIFERNPFYSKAQYIVDTDNKTAEEIAEEIILLL
jgi:shikimate kinase